MIVDRANKVVDGRFYLALRPRRFGTSCTETRPPHPLRRRHGPPRAVHRRRVGIVFPCARGAFRLLSTGRTLAAAQGEVMKRAGRAFERLHREDFSPHPRGVAAMRRRQRQGNPRASARNRRPKSHTIKRLSALLTDPRRDRGSHQRRTEKGYRTMMEITSAPDQPDRNASGRGPDDPRRGQGGISGRTACGLQATAITSGCTTSAASITAPRRGRTPRSTECACGTAGTPSTASTVG